MEQVPRGTFRKFYASAYRLQQAQAATEHEDAPAPFVRQEYLAWIESVATWRRLAMLLRTRQQHVFAAACFDKCKVISLGI